MPNDKVVASSLLESHNRVGGWCNFKKIILLRVAAAFELNLPDSNAHFAQCSYDKMVDIQLQTSPDLTRT